MTVFEDSRTAQRLEEKLEYQYNRNAELQDLITEVADDNAALRLRVKELESLQPS